MAIPASATGAVSRPVLGVSGLIEPVPSRREVSVGETLRQPSDRAGYQLPRRRRCRHRQLPVGVKLQSLRLAVRPPSPARRSRSRRLLRPNPGRSPRRGTGRHDVEISLEARTLLAAVKPNPEPALLEARTGPELLQPLQMAGQQPIINRFPIHAGWLLLVAAPTNCGNRLSRPKSLWPPY